MQIVPIEQAEQDAHSGRLQARECDYVLVENVDHKEWILVELTCNRSEVQDCTFKFRDPVGTNCSLAYRVGLSVF